MRVVGGGIVTFPAGVPTLVASPLVSALARTGGGGANGDLTLTLVQGGVDSAECMVVCTEIGTLAASGASSFGCTHTSDTAKRITSLREGAAGAASALADIPFNFVILQIRPGELYN